MIRRLKTPKPTQGGLPGAAKSHTARCYVCHASESSLLCEISTGSIVRCADCGTVYRSSVVTGEEYDSLYQDAATMETPFYLANRTAADPDVEPMPTYRRGLDRLEQLVSPGRLLDVGCSYGAFLQLANRRGWAAQGVEFSRITADFARGERSLTVFTGTVEEASFPDDHFQAVTLWDVIEHFDDPVGTMREIDRILAPEGILLVFTINQESLLNAIGHLLYRLTGMRWKHLMALFYDIHHNFFFSPETIRGLLRRSGDMDVVDIRFGAASVRRWRTVPIHPLLIVGSDVIDLLSGPLRRRYRMFVYARKRRGSEELTRRNRS
jgi:2-polyprenyl-3-methyl-5-hydroxy-6-metoxy-1,4-benzoquinol methylase